MSRDTLCGLLPNKQINRLIRSGRPDLEAGFARIERAISPEPEHRDMACEDVAALDAAADYNNLRNQVPAHEVD